MISFSFKAILIDIDPNWYTSVLDSSYLKLWLKTKILYWYCIFVLEYLIVLSNLPRKITKIFLILTKLMVLQYKYLSCPKWLRRRNVCEPKLRIVINFPFVFSKQEWTDISNTFWIKSNSEGPDKAKVSSGSGASDWNQNRTEGGSDYDVLMSYTAVGFASIGFQYNNSIDLLSFNAFHRRKTLSIVPIS